MKLPVDGIKLRSTDDGHIEVLVLVADAWFLALSEDCSGADIINATADIENADKWPGVIP